LGFRLQERIAVTLSRDRLLAGHEFFLKPGA